MHTRPNASSNPWTKGPRQVGSTLPAGLGASQNTKKAESQAVPDISELDFDASDLIQFVPQYEEYGVADIKEYDPKAFKLFKDECARDINQAITEMDTHHVEFSGQMSKGKKEGKGGYHNKDTGDFYYGHW